MLSVNILLFVCLGYVALLFAVAFIVDRRTRRKPIRWLQSSVIYTLSISIYCTSWTFYGAVGSAARSGLEFITIYLGPTLVFIGWWWLLRNALRSQRLNAPLYQLQIRFEQVRVPEGIDPALGDLAPAGLSGAPLEALGATSARIVGELACQ